MLAYVNRNGPPEALACPVLLCDQCSTPIQGDFPNNGIVIWRNNPDQTQQVAHVHKGRCDRDYEDAHPGSPWLWEELQVWLEQLVRNVREPFPAERNVEYVAPAPSTWRQGRYESSSRR